MKVTTKASPKFITKVNTKTSSATTTNPAISEAINVAIVEATSKEAVEVKTVAAEVANLTIREADKIINNSKPRNPSTTKHKQCHVNNKCLNQ